jgi:DNA mismatch endonuclease (patch repair protein)
VIPNQKMAGREVPEAVIENKKSGRNVARRTRSRPSFSKSSPQPSRDRITPERRSYNMSRIRGKNTAPEIIVRRLLHKMGYRFRLHPKIPVPREGQHVADPKQNQGRRHAIPPNKYFFIRPDLVLPKYKIAIFVHGCFWHRHRNCKNCTTPTHRQEFWLTKLNGNATRDKLHQRALRQLGWRVLIVWECETKKLAKLETRIKSKNWWSETPSSR